MSDHDPSSERDPLDLLTEQFLQRRRAGEAVTVEAFAGEHEEHAESLRDLLPTLLALEEVKRDRASSGSGQSRVHLPALERLGDFRIERELGRGGMGVVFEAVQESLERRVALKVIPQASLLTGNQLERFRREAQIAARLHHTNIVPVYGSGEDDGYHWYAMQYIAGKSLDRWRADQQEHLPDGSGAWRNRARFIARLGAAAAGALHCAHGFGTLHRDIKPANFLLDHDDHLWVTDFGLAKALEVEGLTHSGDVLGTLQYMAPEQFAGQYDVRSEVYALGVTLYELLALRPAFRARNRSELIERVQAQRVEPLARTSADVPTDLVVIIEKAMARDPADRYQDAEQLQSDLEAFVEDRPILARRLSTMTALWRWCRRNRGLATSISAATAAVLVAAITGWAAYVITEEALGNQKRSAELARTEGERAENNLLLTLSAFGDVFDALVGRDPALGFDEDPDTGEQTVIVHSPLASRDVVLLKQMLAFYDEFAKQNDKSQSLRYETARAYRRVGAIHSRLGGPENLADAEAAFLKALQGLAGISDRDVRRDIATVHVDLGHTYQRRGRPEAATGSMRQALRVLEDLADADSVAVRLERAKVLFEISRTSRFPGGGGRIGRSGRGPRGREQLAAALVLVQQLLAEDAEAAEALALKARCLIDGSRSMRRWFGSDREDEQESLDEAITILRKLVREHPDRPDYRFELCEAILAGFGGHSPVDERLALLREADDCAARLFAEQPLFQEYRALYGQVLMTYGRQLYASSKELAGERAAGRLAQARVTLQSALTVQLELVPDDGRVDPRFARRLIEARAALGRILLFEGSDAEARDQAVEALDLAERQAELRPRRPPSRDVDRERPPRPDGDRRGNGNRERRRDRGGREGRPAARGRGDARGLDALLKELDDAELTARMAAIRQLYRGR